MVTISMINKQRNFKGSYGVLQTLEGALVRWKAVPKFPLEVFTAHPEESR